MGDFLEIPQVGFLFLGHSGRTTRALATTEEGTAHADLGAAGEYGYFEVATHPHGKFTQLYSKAGREVIAE